MKIITSQKEKELLKLLFQKIEKDLENGEQVYLVVPAQANLSVEKTAFDILGKQGFFNLRIVRGQKLQEEILRECGYPDMLPINSVGRALLMRKAASELGDELKTFSSVCRQNGFIDMAGDFTVQMKQNNVSEAELESLCGTLLPDGLLKDKLSDMLRLYKEYEKLMAGKFTDSDDMLEYITAHVPQSGTVRNSVICFYGFYSFTKREYSYLSALESCSKGLCVALLCGEGERFEISRITRQKLSSLAGGAELISGSYSGEFLSGLPEGGLRIVRCANPYTQAQTIAADIRRLIREKGWHYSDIAVLTGNSDSIASTLKRVFESFGIPVFADEKRNILHTSAVDCILALMDIVTGGFQTEDVLRFIKSGICGFERDDTELFENYCKLYHIKEKRFHTPFKYGKDQFAESFEKLEDIRRTLSQMLQAFDEDLKKSETVRDKALCLYAFIDNELHFFERINSLAQAQVSEGFEDAAEESARTGDAVVSLLEQMVELTGDDIVSCAEFADSLRQSFADIKVGVLPQAEGRVQLGSIMRSYTFGKKAVYVAGFNDGLIPEDGEAAGILTRQELDEVGSRNIQLAKTQDSLMQEQLFSIYKALDGASGYLWLGYCVSDEKGGDAKISSLLTQIKNAFPGTAEESDISADCGYAFLEGPELGIEKMTPALRNAMSGAAADPMLLEIYNLKGKDDPSIREGLKYSAEKAALGHNLSARLFADRGTYSLSPSRMDAFAACPFRHFVSYGLRPSVPEDFSMGGNKIGTIYHEALMALCSRIDDWNSVSDEKIEALVDEILNEIAAEKLDGVMNSGKAEIYTGKRVKQVCIRFAKHMAEQIRESGVEKMYQEASFGRHGVFPPVTVNTSAGKVFLEGRIDRVDICPDENGKYIRVVDYKSGNKKFSKNLIEKGLSLQLMMYLEGVGEEYKAPSKCGIYYFNIKDPSVASGLEDFCAGQLSEEVIERIKKEYRLDGMDVDEEFRLRFRNTLSGLCEKLISGNIDVEPKKIGTSYDSCDYCEFSGICLKDAEDRFF